MATERHLIRLLMTAEDKDKHFENSVPISLAATHLQADLTGLMTAASVVLPELSSYYYAIESTTLYDPQEVASPDDWHLLIIDLLVYPLPKEVAVQVVEKWQRQRLSAQTLEAFNYYYIVFERGHILWRRPNERE